MSPEDPRGDEAHVLRPGWLRAVPHDLEGLRAGGAACLTCLYRELRGSQGRGLEHRSRSGLEHNQQLRVRDHRTSCYLRPPFVGTPLSSL